MRTKNQVHALTGHLSTVTAIQCQTSDPQIITGKSSQCSFSLLLTTYSFYSLII